MTNAQTAFAKLQESGLFREVEEQNIRLTQGKTIPDKKALVYKDTQEYISTVGRNYELIQNQEVYERVFDAMDASDLDTTYIEVNPHVQPQRSIVDFIFPTHQAEVKVGDITQLKVSVRNSYDGSWKILAKAGGYRLACTNGQVVPAFLSGYKSRHTSGFSMEQMIAQLNSSILAFQRAVEYWKYLSNEPVDIDSVYDVLFNFLGKKVKDEDHRSQMIESSRQTTFQALLNSFKNYSEEMGQTQYALYNTLTDYATHSSDRADYQDFRSNMVVKSMSILPNSYSH